jgi:tRNA pseudouridine38-40 synthase
VTRTLRLFIEYDGTAFAGWQAQGLQPTPELRTVQGVLQDAVAQMIQTRVPVRGASRTDAGVHAEGQVAAFDTTSDISVHGFARGLNRYLPPDVAVWKVEEAAPGWNPKRSSRGKCYRYTFWAGPTRPALERHRVWHVRGALDPAAMHRAAQTLLGTHDFTSFRAAGCVAKHAVRSLYGLTVQPGVGPRLTLEVLGNAFVRNMVRIIAGTLAEVGLGRRDPDLGPVLDRRNRAAAGVTAPPQGLVLHEVVYDDRLPPRPQDGEHLG